MSPNQRDQNTAERLVETYVANMERIETTRRNLHTLIENAALLKPYVHSIKSRLKDPEHLREKLLRKIPERRKSGRPAITKDNLLTEVNDLAGVRILHLYTQQFVDIDRALRHVLSEENYSLLEGPIARTWDIEYEQYFESIGVESIRSEDMYTSVHYIVAPSPRTTCEIQVRTLMEEVWGEVDHTLNYPSKSESVACREQLKVLARATSTATRLVDAIFTIDRNENTNAQ